MNFQASLEGVSLAEQFSLVDYEKYAKASTTGGWQKGEHGGTI